MPHTTQSKAHADKVQSIIDFAAHLTRWISNPPHTEASPFPDSDLYFAALPLSRSEISPSQRVELDQKGVQLWNACCRTSCGDEEQDEKSQAHIAKARAFAWLVVESAARETVKHVSARAKSFRSATRAAKGCLAVGDLQLGAKIIERVAERQPQFSEAVADSDEDAQSVAHECQAELLLLQLTLAWKRERFDMAEHFYNSFDAASTRIDATFPVKAADLLYEIGRDLLQQGHHDLASKWLGRASSSIEPTRESCAAVESQDLRLNILHTYVRALLATNSTLADEEADRVLNLLKSEFGHKLAVTLLGIEVLTRNPCPDTETYYNEIVKVIRIVHLIDANHRLIMHYLHHLKTLSHQLALQALKQYIVQRLAPEESCQYTEAAVVTFIWMATSGPSRPVSPSDLDADLTLVRQIWNRDLNPEAAHAAFLLLWREIDKADQEDSRDDLLSWCGLALNNLLGRAGDANIGKVHRKLVFYHMELPDLQAAIEQLIKMSNLVRQHPLSLSLAYSVAVRCCDEAAAESALSSIVKLKDKDNRLLLACVGETMKYGDQRRGAKLLQRVLDKFNYELPPEIDTCTLLRCTARLLISVLDQVQTLDHELLARLCSIFKAAANYSSKCNEETGNEIPSFSLQDCQWFERSSYNVAVQHLDSWPAKYVVDLMEYSSQIRYPQEVLDDESVNAKTTLYLNAQSIQAVLYTTEARRCDSTWSIEDLPRTSYRAQDRPTADTIRFHLYRCAFNKYTRLSAMFAGNQNASAELQPFKNELETKLVSLLPPAFEALLFMNLEQGMSLSLAIAGGLVAVIDQACELKAPAKTFAVMADSILSSAMHGSTKRRVDAKVLPLPTAIELLRRVINAIRNQSDYDIVRAARWIRCVVQLVLDHHSASTGKDNEGAKTGEDDSLAVVASIVDEALNLARDALNAAEAKASNEADEYYPSDELHWLSTTLFNVGVDYYVAENQGEAKKWAGKAVELADALGRNPRSEGGDEGGLMRALRERCGKMGWDV